MFRFAATDPLVRWYWEDVMQGNEEEYIVPDMTAALERLLQPGYFLYQGRSFLLRKG